MPDPVTIGFIAKSMGVKAAASKAAIATHAGHHAVHAAGHAVGHPGVHAGTSATHAHHTHNSSLLTTKLEASKAHMAAAKTATANTSMAPPPSGVHGIARQASARAAHAVAMHPHSTAAHYAGHYAGHTATGLEDIPTPPTRACPYFPDQVDPKVGLITFGCIVGTGGVVGAAYYGLNKISQRTRRQ
jgi:hypothetical protein